MALIKLSEEEKNKLLKESEDKLAECKVLEKKTWQDLWHEDLDNFMAELDKQEAKEKADIETSIKNAAKKLAADAKAGRGGKKAVAAEVLPSKDGQRVEPKLDAATKAKYEKMSQPKKERVKKEPKEEKKPKKEGMDIKKFMSPAGDKKTKEAEKKKKDEWNSDLESDASDVEFDVSYLATFGIFGIFKNIFLFFIFFGVFCKLKFFTSKKISIVEKIRLEVTELTKINQSLNFKLF